MTVSSERWADPPKATWVQGLRVCGCGHPETVHAHPVTGRQGPCRHYRGPDATRCGCGGFVCESVDWVGRVTLPVGVTPGGAL